MENNVLFDFIAGEIARAKLIDLEAAKIELTAVLKKTGISLEDRETDFADFELMAILEESLGEFPNEEYKKGIIPEDSYWGRLRVNPENQQ